MTVTLHALTRYPVKGLSGEPLDSVTLEAGQGFPDDRRFGFARPDSGFDPAKPRPLSKFRFYMLARDARLALLDSAYDDDTDELTLTTPDASARFDISTDVGKQGASAFIKTFLELPDGEMPELFEASPHRFTDVSVDSAEMMNAVSLINLDSVQAFAANIGREVDPRRFRGNILITGLPPFAELEHVGRQILVGNTRLSVLSRTQRCAATTVNLATAQRDITVPKLLQQQYGHMDMGVYCEVLEGGTIAPGDAVAFL